MGVGSQRHAPAALSLGKTQVPIVQEAGWASGLDWTGAENLVLTAIRSPDRPALASRYAVYGYKFDVVKDKLIREWCGLRNKLS
jgi:hypothetical protein